MSTRKIIAFGLASLMGLGLWANLALAKDVQIYRRGGVAYLQKLVRPAIVEQLLMTAEPMELARRDLAVLEAFMAANSTPRRTYRDEFYSREFAVRGMYYDDPVNRTLVGNAAINYEEWQRLRTHVLYNRLLLAEHPAPVAPTPTPPPAPPGLPPAVSVPGTP